MSAWLLAAAVADRRCGSALLAQAPTFTQVGQIPGPAESDRGRRRAAPTSSAARRSRSSTSRIRRRRSALGAYTFPEKIWGFRVVGTTVYVAADFFGLGILDVSNPAAPVLRGSLKTPGQAKNVAVVGTTALVADHMSGVDFIDVADTAKPVNRGRFFLDGYARDVVSAGSMAYAIDAPAGLYIFDLSKPGPLEPVGSQQSASAPASIELSKGRPARARTLAVLVGGGHASGLRPHQAGGAGEGRRRLKTPSGRPSRATLHGTRAYVADCREGLQVVDLSTPSAPALVGSFKTPEPARDVAVTDTHVFVVVGAPAKTKERS